MCNLKQYKSHMFSPAIFRASHKGDVRKIKQLILKGIDINICERDGLTPLMVASLAEKIAAVKMLIDNGANVNAQDNNGMTPLTHALQNTWLHRSLSRLIYNTVTLASGRQPDFCRYYYSEVTKKNDMAKILISNGADANLADAHNMTPLMYTAVWGNEEITALLLSRGANVDEKNKDGTTPLMLATLRGFPSIVKILIESGADVNYCNDDGISVMTMASYKNNKEILELLRAKGAKGEVLSCSLKK